MKALVRWLGCCVTAGALLSCSYPANAAGPRGLAPAADGGDTRTTAEHGQAARCIREGVPLAFCGKAVLLAAAGADAGARPTLSAEADARPVTRPPMGSKWR
ncbi:hypothetical protein OKW37_002644 [Paraburkholderia sp. MM5482-R2]